MYFPGNQPIQFRSPNPCKSPLSFDRCTSGGLNLSASLSSSSSFNSLARELGDVREDDDVIDDDILEDEVLGAKKRGNKGSDELDDLEAEEMVILNIIKVEVISWYT